MFTKKEFALNQIQLFISCKDEMQNNSFEFFDFHSHSDSTADDDILK
jgi:hypothetical protein